MALPKIPVGLIVLCLLLAILGGLWGVHASGLINLNTVLQDLPFVGKNFVEDEFVEIITPLEKENEALQGEINKLQQEISNLKKEKKELEAKALALEKQAQGLDKKVNSLQKEEKEVFKLADYYNAMKAKEIVPIFEGLEDDLVLKILLQLEDKKVGQILAEMDPMRAAIITRSLSNVK